MTAVQLGTALQQDKLLANSHKIIQAAAGAGGAGEYVEDVFSIDLYVGDSGTGQTITNGIDLSGEGGMVWFKTRSTANAHNIYDTERGNGEMQYITTEPTYTNSTNPWTPSSTGFNTGDDFGGSENQNGADTVAWTFRKAPGFFDVVTWTGNGGVGRQISHNLGSTPGFVAIKRTDSSDNWKCWHTGTGDGVTFELDGTSGDTGENWPTGGFTSTYFTVNSGGAFNASGGTYVAYLFAHDDQQFGDSADESIIKCGSFNAAADTDINLGWEPQWVMFKNSSSTSNWQIIDMMRGFVNYSPDKQLLANSNTTEGDSALASPTATGFTWVPSASGNTYIYIAIRKPMKIPESGSEVFGYQEWTGNDVAGRKITLSGVDRTDLFIHKRSDANAGPYWTNRHLGRGSTASGLYGQLNSSASSADDTSNIYFDTHNGVILEATTQTNGSPDPFLGLGFKRARGFMDIVAYTGTGTAGDTQTHNLGVTPELIFVKQRDALQIGLVYNKTITASKYLTLFDTSSGDTGATSDTGGFNGTAPTSSVFTLGSYSNVNGSGNKYAAYLFATLAGVSKVGSVTVSGSTNVDCGFSSSARFVMLKRTDATGDWFVFYKIVSGNDTYFRFNNAGAKVATSDFVGTYSSGFTVESGFTNGDYIFLAIA